MANKKKKNKKNNKMPKALVIFILVISAVCLGLSLGNKISGDTQQQNNVNKGQAFKNNDDIVNKDKEPEQGNDNKKTTIKQEHQEVDNIIEDKDTTKEDEVNKIEKNNDINDEKKEDDKEESNEEKENDKEEIPQGSSDEDNFDMNVDTSTLSNQGYGWTWKRNKEHIKPIAYNKIDIKKYGGYYAVDTEEKVAYLTFDEGYENGYTPSILDTLKANDIKATFFVTKDFLEKNKELAIRMKEEGHIVGNHSVNHTNMHELSDEKVEYEIVENARYFEEVTGYKIDTFFRPPNGEYSERTLYLTRKLGYKSIFYSVAYADWYTNAQKGKEYAYNHVMQNSHPGMIILLHAVSSSNTEALDDILKSLKEEGYRFGNLYELE
ncbi:MAG: polysaccharide deacetylase family protein [Vallitalea sp.]|jgi:peptidoglycan-N-acetylmuramic acid deacetylase|nr:polysaccharide deacetylase family protein [Vallitalea sp.]